jgi:hypothetical protein
VRNNCFQKIGWDDSLEFDFFAALALVADFIKVSRRRCGEIHESFELFSEWRQLKGGGSGFIAQ